MLLSGAEEKCVICNSSLKALQEGEDYNKHLYTCSEICERKNNNKTWPIEEDCPGCPHHINGPHKLSCRAHGSQQIKIFVKSI